MKLSEAIKSSADLVSYFRYNHRQSKLSLSAINSYADAVQLGIEALERQKKIRSKAYSEVSIDDVYQPLPSEE